MPKIIHNIEKRIEQCAAELFTAYDASQVDMKMIAKKCNIAVGTLYNYYPNKKELYIHVLKNIWSSTFEDLEAIYVRPLSPEEKLSQTIETLYDHMVHRKGMAKLIYRVLAYPQQEGETVEIFHSLFFQIERIFENFEKKSFVYNADSLNTRLTQSLLMIIISTILTYPSSREDNLHFIQDFFYNSMHVDMNLKTNYLKDHEV